MRKITKVYDDPTELIWLWAAERVGMKVERDSTVFASWNGDGVLRIGTPETLDPDDSLAQMILHEMCHFLVEGPQAWDLPDWGLANDPVCEHACLRLQAALTGPYNLRNFFGATTVFRTYFDRIPANPLEDDSDPAVSRAAAGWARAQEEPWLTTLTEALTKTASIRSLIGSLAPPASLWSHS